MNEEDRLWQRLDKFLWHARVMRQRTDCARLAAGGLLRINRQPTDKPHAKVRVGDVITLAVPGPHGGQVRVLPDTLVLSRLRTGLGTCDEMGLFNRIMHDLRAWVRLADQFLADAPELDPKEVASKTFEVHADEKPTGGYRFGVFLKTV